jgi:glutamate/tyrosine decarboxylase-like PLP-dependent enzyme
MIKHLGRDGIAAMVARHCRLARRIADGLAAEPGLRVLNEVCLNQVLVRFGADDVLEAGDALTRRTIERIQAVRQAWRSVWEEGSLGDSSS